MKELVLISVTGEDKPGVTATIAKLLGDHDVDVLDLGQAVIHQHLSLGILVNVPDASEHVFKALLFESHRLGVQISFAPVPRTATMPGSGFRVPPDISSRCWLDVSRRLTSRRFLK